MHAAGGRGIGWTLRLALWSSGWPRARHVRADESRLGDYFGFLPLEIYKLDTRINGLLLEDLDGDKIDDIVVINNARSRIDMLLSGKKAGDGAGRAKEGPTRSPTTAGCGW